MKRTILTLLFVVLLTAWMGLGAESLVSVAHVSYLDGELTVTNRDGKEHSASLNFPVVSGDILRTAGEGRAEIQFGNGTLLRMDQSSELLVGTILAPILTSKNMKLTTVELKSGAVYVISNTYNSEVLQVVSADVAVKFPSNSNIEIRVEPQEGTRVASLWGKGDLLITTEDGNEQAYTLKSKSVIQVGKDGQLSSPARQPAGDFLAWNKDVDDNFKKLHEGKSFVPEKIIRHGHLQRWAERWGSSFGTWEYDKMFGYVWKPDGFSMDPYRRPFYNGTLTEINGVQYVIPNEPWGWAPAHLGTWVFLKKWGWTWIPGQGMGEIFMPRVNTLMDWIWRIWGSSTYYYAYLDNGYRAWQGHHASEYGAGYKLNLDAAPTVVKTILKKMELSHPHRVKDMLAQQSDEFVNKDQHKAVIVAKTGFRPIDKDKIGESVKLLPVDKDVAETEPKAQGVLKDGSAGQVIQLRHDWNPDRQWATQNRVQLLYSSHSNSVIVPQKQLDSASMSSQQRSAITRSYSEKGAFARSTASDSGRSDSTSSSASSGNSSSGSSSKEKK